MRNAFMLALTLAVFLDLGISGLSALGEEKISIGETAGWNALAGGQGVTRISRVRPHEVLALVPNAGQSAAGNGEGVVDMALSFDEPESSRFFDAGGNYRLSVGSHVLNAKSNWARQGAGAAFFPGGGVLKTPAALSSDAGDSAIRIRAAGDSALFAAGKNIEDFSIEFWLYPVTMEGGEHIIGWTAALPGLGRQELSCSAYKTRLVWNFENFFTSTGGERALLVRLNSKKSIVPKTWSHHQVRFNASSGLLEYLVNGALEDLVYTTPSGSEGGGAQAGEIYTPVVGQRGAFTLGEHFNGLLDEFSIKKAAAGPAPQGKYGASGSFYTKPLRVGTLDSAILQINAKGGRVHVSGNGVKAQTRQNQRLRFDGNAEIALFARVAQTPADMPNSRWLAFTPGSPIVGLRGRYIEIRGDFYPSDNREESPYLESLEVVYTPRVPVAPPERIVATTENGAVTLRWPVSSDPNLGGYLVYYGKASGEYLGEGASAGGSPLDVGVAGTVRIDNLNNGSVYYFSVSAYDKSGPSHAGDYSKEISARPLRMELYD